MKYKNQISHSCFYVMEFYIKVVYRHCSGYVFFPKTCLCEVKHTLHSPLKTFELHHFNATKR